MEVLIMYDYYNDDYLMHYGVKGMKWGHRKAQSLQVSDTRRRFDSAKADYKSAKKDYNKAYNKAYNYSNRHMVSQFISKKKSAEADKRWADAHDKALKTYDAKKEYKQAKQERKQQIKDTYKKIDKNASFGEKFLYNDATREKAAKYVVDNNMSIKEANARAKSDAKRNTALILSAYGAVAVGAYIKSKR